MDLRRATSADLIALLDARSDLMLPTKRYARALAQVALSEAYAAYRGPDDLTPLAIAGLAPVGQGGELWFGCRSGGLGRDLAALALTARRVLRDRRPDYPSGIFCLVRDDNVAGHRLAGAIGFRPQPVVFMGHREWTLEEQR